MKSKDEAVEWVKRAPFHGREEAEIDIRQFHELEDFEPILMPELKQR